MGTSQNGDKSEYVAGILGDTSSSYLKNIKNAPQKYWNNYTLDQISKPGDGTLEISWGTTSWLSASYPVFYRRSGGGVFYADSYYGYGVGDVSSRAVVVCGAGL